MPAFIIRPIMPSFCRAPIRHYRPIWRPSPDSHSLRYVIAAVIFPPLSLWQIPIHSTWSRTFFLTSFQLYFWFHLASSHQTNSCLSSDLHCTATDQFGSISTPYYALLIIGGVEVNPGPSSSVNLLSNKSSHQLFISTSQRASQLHH